ncbi:hypothetical protein FQZ97_986450 [compost metagenome]
MQIQAFAKGIVDEIRSANNTSEPSHVDPKISAARATNPAPTRELQLEQLNREGLRYEEYQRQYREIVGY